MMTALLLWLLTLPALAGGPGKVVPTAPVSAVSVPISPVFTPAPSTRLLEYQGVPRISGLQDGSQRYDPKNPEILGARSLPSAVSAISSPDVSVGEAKSIADEDWQRRVEGKDGGLNIWVAASEAVPFVKTGGLADVTDGLSRELAEQGHRVTLVLPKYKGIDLSKAPAPRLLTRRVKLPGGKETRVWQTRSGKIDVLLVDEPEYFHRDNGIYGSAYGDHVDNDERFLFFSQAVLEAARALGAAPDVIHAHDWQTGMVPALLARTYGADPFFARTASVFTVHNMAYQGLFPITHPAQLEYWGKTSFLKNGLATSDKLTTVSRTYSREVRASNEMGRGMEGLLNERNGDFTGIVNGLDPKAWDPETDPEIPFHYTRKAWKKAKTGNKLALQRELGLPVGRDIPLFAIAARLDPQKGLDLVAEAAPVLAMAGAQLVIVGNGTQALTEQFQQLMKDLPESVFARTVFDEKFARKIFAASDFYLMPSRFEPCGLSQLIAMRYGSVPLVSPVGGLLDTVDDYDADARAATGYILDEDTHTALEEAILKAIRNWRGPPHERMVRNGMKKDTSWRLPARQYLEVYRKAIAKKRAGLSAATGPRTLYSDVGVALGDGMLVKGSKETGGTQADFRIDYQDKDLMERLVLPARAIANSSADDWEKVRAVQALVRSQIPRNGMSHPGYSHHNEDLTGPEVSLGNYIRCRAGVCRENGLLTALALREAGLQARFAYFLMHDTEGDAIQDHALALVDIGGTTYVVDSFRMLGQYFNGHRLVDLINPPADGKYPQAGPLAAANRSHPGRWRFEPNAYPSITR